MVAGASWWDETATKEIRSSFASEPSQSHLENRPDSDKSSKYSYSLTHREQEVLSLLAAGKTNQEIALALLLPICIVGTLVLIVIFFTECNLLFF